MFYPSFLFHRAALVPWENKVIKVNTDCPVPGEVLANLAKTGDPESMATRDQQDPLDPVETLETPAQLVTLAARDPLALVEHR